MFLLLVMSFPVMVQAQEIPDTTGYGTEKEGKVSVDFGADLVSRFIWRGQDFGQSPAIQPAFSVSAWGFTLGAWGSYGFSRYAIKLNDSTTVDVNYVETDLFLSYTWKYFTLMLFDYYAPYPAIDSLDGNNYFNYRNQSTLHTLEGSLIFNGPEKFPLQLLVATMFYGADKDKDSTGAVGAGDKNNYSTYLEISYPFYLKGFELKPFIGGIPFESSWYGDRAGITCFGLESRKEIPVTKRFSIPVKVTLMANPMAKKVYFVFGITL
jgi:hypothetical protein